MRHTDDVVQNALIHGTLGFVLYKLHVQLQHVQRHLAEHTQRGITAAEVVHLHNKAQLPECRHRCDDFTGIFRIGALGNLQMEISRVYIIFPYKILKRLYQIPLIYISPGDIDGNRQERISLFLPVAQQSAHLFPNILV